MGCGGDQLESNQVFKMQVKFFDPGQGGVDEADPITLEPVTLAAFADAINQIVFPGRWVELGNIILLKGPIQTGDQAAEINRRCNEVLKGLRVAPNGASTGVAGRVTSNEGPVPEEDVEEAASFALPSTANNGWSPPATGQWKGVTVKEGAAKPKDVAAKPKDVAAKSKDAAAKRKRPARG